MTVEQLRKMLSYFDDDQEVYLSFPSGDYWGTTLASKVASIDSCNVVWSEYHRAYKLVEEDNEEKYEDGERREIVLLT